jgi:hypothetical protein
MTDEMRLSIDRLKRIIDQEKRGPILIKKGQTLYIFSKEGSKIRRK